MKNRVNIGCSSFYNQSWKEVFYPEDIPSAKWFDYYCSQLNTFEINSTFYKFPTFKIMENWYKRTPIDFLLSVKAPKEITHVKKFIDCEGLIKDFYSLCNIGLKEKLGCILFQFPPSFQYSNEKLLLIISQLDFSFRNVVEFRHESWWIPEVFITFANNNVTFCSVSHPKLPTTIFTNQPVIYIRLHGRSKMFYSAYSTEELEAIKNQIISSKETTSTYIYFNNTASSAGILNALEIKKIGLLL